MEILGWLAILMVALGVAVAPAFPSVRRLLGLSSDTAEARAVRNFLHFWDRREDQAEPGEAERLAAVRMTRQGRGFAYPQQLPSNTPEGDIVAPTNLDLLERDRYLFAQADEAWGEANVLNLIGFIRERHGEFDQALEMHRRALSLFERIQEPLGIGDSHNNLGVVLARMGKTSAALAHHNRALEIRLELDDVRVSNSHNNIAVVLSAGGAARALKHLQEATEISAACEEDSRGMGKIINNATVLEIESGCAEGRGEELCQRFSEALALRSVSEDQRGNAKTENNLGIVYVFKGDVERAVAHFDVAATLAGSVEDHVGLLHVLLNWRQLIEARSGSTETIRQLNERIAAGHDVIKGKALMPDCEAFPLVGEADGGLPQTALLSSGSATPATASDLADRLRHLGSAA